MSIEQLEDTYIEDLKTLSDWFLQYEYLVRLGTEMAHMDESEKTEANRIAGCQTGMWVTIRKEDGKMRIAADSNALLMRGVLAILTALLNGRTASETASWEPRFVENTAIGAQLSAERSRGFRSAVEKIRSFALSCAGEQ